MPRPRIEQSNEAVMSWVKTYWIAGCRVGNHKPHPIRLHHAIDDAIFGASVADSTGYPDQPKLSCSKLMTILALLPVISTSAILGIFGKKKDALILKGKGFDERQAQHYAIGARIASNAIKDYMDRHPEEVLSDLEGVNEPLYKEDMPE